jgi:hypothetical protein
MAGHISFNPLSTEASFLKNKSDPNVSPSHVGEPSIVGTLNKNGPALPDGYTRSHGLYETAPNTPRTHKNNRGKYKQDGIVRTGTSAKNAMTQRNESAARGFAHVNKQLRSRGLGNYYEKGNANLSLYDPDLMDPVVVGMRRSRVRNQGNAENVGILLENNLHAEGLNIAPELRYARGKNLKPAPARGALKGSRNKARARNEAARAEASARAQAEANARAQAEADAELEAEAARYQEAEQSIVNNRSRHPLNKEQKDELNFIKSQEEVLKEHEAIERSEENRGNFSKLGGAYKKRRTIKKNKRHTRKHRGS